jgi:uncharacterized protein
MNCPVCNVPLTMSERQGIEIDYCPQCRGVWLDRGELDKIIEQSTTRERPGGIPGGREPAMRQPGYRHEQERYDDDDDHRPRGRKNWLQDLFD